MRTFFQLLSWIFHPLLVPFYAVLIFFKTTTFLLDFSLQWQIIRLVALLTLAFPLVVYWFLKSRRLADDPELSKTKQRFVPLIFYAVLLCLLIYRLYGVTELKELRMMFYGFLISIVFAVFGLMFKFKSSLHVLFVANVWAWLLSFGVYSGAEVRSWLVLVLLAVGVISSGRLYLKAHKPAEVYGAFFLALLAHLLVYPAWY